MASAITSMPKWFEISSIPKMIAAAFYFSSSAPVRGHSEKQPRWTREALDSFFSGPESTVPDHEMGFLGLRNSAERAALIDYLAAR